MNSYSLPAQIALIINHSIHALTCYGGKLFVVIEDDFQRFPIDLLLEPRVTKFWLLDISGDHRISGGDAQEEEKEGRTQKGEGEGGKGERRVDAGRKKEKWESG